MQPPEISRLLTRWFYRRVIIFKIMQLVTCGCAGAAFLLPGGWRWAIGIFLICVLFTIGWAKARGGYLSARKVFQNPQFVYWAHPANPKDSRVSAEPVNGCKLLTLHLRDGTQFQPYLSAKDMPTFIAWLKEQNPSVRLGPYDDDAQTTTRPA
jgi:hypothetical protein